MCFGVERMLPFDALSSLQHGWVVVHPQQLGNPIGMVDAMIAATALSAGSTRFVTRNTKKFTDTDTDTDLPLVNPWITQWHIPHSTVVQILAVG